MSKREADADAAQKAVAASTKVAARAEARVEALDTKVAELTDNVARLTHALRDVATNEELAAALDAATAAADERSATAAAFAQAEVAAATASKRLGESERAESSFRQTLLAARDKVADLEPPTPTGSSLADDWAALSRWSRARHESLEVERTELAASGKELAAAKAAVVERLTTAVEPYSVDADPATIARSLAAARGYSGGRGRPSAGAARPSGRARNHGGCAERGQSGRRRTRPRQHLAAGGFERWLLAEALDDIVARATVRLNDLSNGRYSLEADGGSFHVRDHGNADERRDVRTLSGGETFLASLALALALADSIAELAPVDSPRLSSIFLDEGFGDARRRHVGRARIGDRRTVGGGSAVAIVTHVRDLADRMPVRFEVRKGSTTSTIERRDG